MRAKVLTLFLTMLVAGPAWAQSSGNKDGALNVVTKVAIEAQTNATRIVVEGNSTPTYSVFKLSNPLRLFVDISNSELGDGVRRAPVEVNNGVISSVAVMEFSDEIQQITRVVVGFDTPATYDVTTEGDRVVIVVEGGGSGNQAQAATQEIERHQRELERARKALSIKERRLAETEERVLALQQALADAKAGDSRDVLARALDANKRAAGELRVEPRVLEALVGDG